MSERGLCCLAVFVAMVAGVAGAQDVVVYDDDIQADWTLGNFSDTAGAGPDASDALSSDFPDAWGWKSTGGAAPGIVSATLEFDFRATSGDIGWICVDKVGGGWGDWKYGGAGAGNTSAVWIDDNQMPEGYGDFMMTTLPGGADTNWHHLKMDMTTTTQNAPYTGEVEELRFQLHNDTGSTQTLYLDNVVFISEGGVPGDTDGDGDVDLDDLFAVRNNFGTASGATVADGDVEPHGAGDGDVDLDDLFTVRNNFGTGSSPIPEPVTISLLGMGAVALLRRRR